jgi:hypothetical protein
VLDICWFFFVVFWRSFLVSLHHKKKKIIHLSHCIPAIATPVVPATGFTPETTAVIVFTYRRAGHLSRMLAALLRCVFGTWNFLIITRFFFCFFFFFPYSDIPKGAFSNSTVFADSVNLTYWCRDFYYFLPVPGQIQARGDQQFDIPDFCVSGWRRRNGAARDRVPRDRGHPAPASP